MVESLQFPRADVLIYIADYFNLSVDYLIGRTNIQEIHKTHNPLSQKNFDLLYFIENRDLSVKQIKIISDYLTIAFHFYEEKSKNLED